MSNKNQNVLEPFYKELEEENKRNILEIRNLYKNKTEEEMNRMYDKYIIFN